MLKQNQCQHILHAPNLCIWMHCTHFSPGLLLEYSSTHTKHISSSLSSVPWLSWIFLMFQARSLRGFEGGGWGGFEGFREGFPPPLIRQKRSKKGPIFCIGPRSTIHKKDPLPSPPPSKILAMGLCFGSFLSCFFGLSAAECWPLWLWLLFLLLSSSPMASFSGVSVKIAVVPLGCTTVTTCPCKIGTTNPRPPYLTKHACSNIPT